MAARPPLTAVGHDAPVPKRSAGLLVWRRVAGGGVEVLLAHPGGPLFASKDVWTVPKGEYGPDEEPLAAARREFAEEIGQPAPAGPLTDLGESRQASGKVNRVFAVEGDLDAADVRSNLFPMVWPPRSGQVQEFPEVDRAGWFDLDSARSKVFPGQLPFLDRLAEALGL
jgi:predicted NUDIX family NTP pyrophosphohydrolase